MKQELHRNPSGKCSHLPLEAFSDELEQFGVPGSSRGFANAVYIFHTSRQDWIDQQGKLTEACLEWWNHLRLGSFTCC